MDSTKNRLFHVDIRSLQSGLLRWYRNNGRQLPWRAHYDPYHVWLSEIMLQQTQMDRGVTYFKRWLKRFPDIQSVAQAGPYEILKYWEGLGYYARGRNLHKAAQLIITRYGGKLPEDHDELLKLPGIGPYTAAAISSIAFNHDIPVVDANVERVFARVFDIDKPLKSKGVHEKIVAIAESLLPSEEARDFNQAMMDLGGLICTPKNPDCAVCPIAQHCLAYLGDFVADRPIKKERQQLIQIEMATGVLLKNGHIFIQQRHENDIWGGLWEFPGGRLFEDERPEQTVVREYLEETSFAVEVCEKITTVIHFYTKYKVTLHCYRCRMVQESLLPDLQAAQAYHWIKEDQLDNYGFPAGHRKFIVHMRQSCPAILQDEC
jgi:A/G-specific adenine glycosylase